ncbi:LETM1 domain-containing protein [Flavobacterium sp. N1861]|uniref:LETM1 domain-containing protein n=1 Tax=Flavobacterium sp. N1861 TaxID=2986825 RepID=UPI0022246C18|nr:LETM1 domain-containing protein [Flavobacterium sp. N1861]
MTKEIVESKELMILLAKSTTKDLDDVEKKKVKKQLLDICKTIPSLTIFLLPGGGILLPILVKYIPQLLPSAFNENLDE